MDMVHLKQTVFNVNLDMKPRERKTQISLKSVFSHTYISPEAKCFSKETSLHETCDFCTAGHDKCQKYIT